MSRPSPSYLIFFLLLFTVLQFNLYGQSANSSYEVVFEKAEGLYAKGKFKKVAKKLKKLRKKDLAKKYVNDSTLLGLAWILEAKADEAMAQYALMNQKIIKGAELLVKHETNNTYAYVSGLLRIVDLYNSYGNHFKADSVLKVAEELDPQIINNELLSAEIEIRRIFTQIEMGFYATSETALTTMLERWQTLQLQAYNGLPITKKDTEYRNGLQVLLMAYHVRLNAHRGDFEVAEELFDKYRKSASRLSGDGTYPYSHLLFANALNAYEWKNFKEARKRASKLANGSPAPHLAEEIMDLAILASLEEARPADAEALFSKQEKLFSKSKTKKSYSTYKAKLNDLIFNVSLADPEENLAGELTQLSGSNLPKDHKELSRLLQITIDYVVQAGITSNYDLLEKTFIELEESIGRRYPRNSIQVGINKVNTAGYFLNYSETPNRAFRYLADEPYKLPMDELTIHHPTYKKIVDDLSEYFIISGNYEYPIKLKKEVIEGLRNNLNITGTELGGDLVELAKLQTLGGDYKEAELNAEEGLKLIRRDGQRKSKEYVQALNSAAFLYGTMGMYDQGKKLLNRSGSILKKLEVNTHELKLNSVEDLAFLYTRLGNYSETEDLLQEVIESKIGLFTENSHRLIKPYAALGELHLIKGEYPEAENFLRKALKQIERTYGDSTLLFAATLEKQVLLDIQLGIYRDALKAASQILAIRTQKLKPGHIKFAEVYQLLGLIYLQSGLDDQLAESYFTQARDIIRNNFDENHPLYAEAIKNIAFIKIKESELQEALSLLNQADDIWARSVGNKNRSSGEVARLKGDIYNSLGEFKQAGKEFEKSARYFKQIFNDLHPDYLSTRSRQARANYIEGELKEVEDLLTETTEAYLQYTQTYFPTLSEEEKAKFWTKIKPDFEFYNTVAVDFKDTKPKYLENMYDFALATKGLLLNSSIKTRNSILNSGDPELVSLFEKWIANKEFLTNTLAQSDQDLSENEIDINKLEDETEQLEKQLSEKSEAFSNSFEYRFYTWSDVQKSLQEHEAAVEIIRYREFDQRFNTDKVRYAALILTESTRRNPELVWLENGALMESKSFSLQRNGVKFKIQEEKSYQTYWKPIHDRISDKSVVYISPDGIYNQINVESLYMGDGKYVIDAMNVRVVNSTKTLAIQRSKDARKIAKKSKDAPKELTALLVGNPDYYQSEQTASLAKVETTRSGASAFIPQLPGTESEVETISDLLRSSDWNIDYLLGKEADEGAIKAAQNKTLIHIATHGFFDENKEQKKDEFQILTEDNPLDRSGLLARGAGDVLLKTSKNYNVEDGILTATEAMNMNFDNTELVVLSACETGRGEIQQGEGVFGLQRSFLVAGADAIVMSLFKVSDEVTQNLMIEFYKNWLGGDEKRVAFNKAQKAIKELYPDPIYWGAFTMVAKN